MKYKKKIYFMRSLIILIVNMSIIKIKNRMGGYFIDTQNLYHTQRIIQRTKIGTNIKDATLEETSMLAIAYVITKQRETKRISLEVLTKMGIETKTKDLQFFSSGAKTAGMGLA